MRYVSQFLQKDLARKLILLCGPRQAGKTTLAKSLAKSAEYLNFDVPTERLMIKAQSWNRSADLLILDELHKLKNWKLFLKGLTNSAVHTMPTIVTGSARLDVARKVGDSLAGRYYLYHLHPIDIKEASTYFKIKPEDAMHRIMTVSGFPEPFLNNHVGEDRRRRSTHSDIILRQDLFDLESVERVSQLETLLELLKARVGSTIAYANLGRELDCAPRTAIEAKWSDDQPHKPFKLFSKEIPFQRSIQLVANLEREKTYPTGLEIRKASSWLAQCDF